MPRILTGLFAGLILIAAPGCIVMTTADIAMDATGAVIGTAGEVVEGAVDVVTPGGKDDHDPEKDAGSH